MYVCKYGLFNYSKRCIVNHNPAIAAVLYLQQVMQMI